MQDEAAKGVVQVKNLATGQQTEVLAFFFYVSIREHTRAYDSIRSGNGRLTESARGRPAERGVDALLRLG